jgi:hypothetical protein
MRCPTSASTVYGTLFAAIGSPKPVGHERRKGVEICRMPAVPSVSIVHAYRGERNEAFEWLEKACESRDADLLVSIRGDPELVPLRADPRYKSLLRKMNLPE